MIVTSKVEQRSADGDGGEAAPAVPASRPALEPSTEPSFEEVVELRVEVARLTRELEEERAQRDVLQRAVGYATARLRALEQLDRRLNQEPTGGAEIVVEPEDLDYRRAYDLVLSNDDGVRVVTRDDVVAGQPVGADGPRPRYELPVAASHQPAVTTSHQPAVPSAGPAAAADNVYVFDDGDESTAAFDAFFATPDPHLDKVRRFLLD